MLFNSFEFIFLFVPIVFATWCVCRRLRRAETAVLSLLLASLLFYAYWNPPFVLLLAASVVVNFAFQRAIYSMREKSLGRCTKIILMTGVALNILLIGYFKYKNFIMFNIDAILGCEASYKELFLPLGISFFTFQQIACLVDTYSGKIQKVCLVDYALFVSFFPQLIAGPIVKYEELIPQIRKVSTERQISLEMLRLGLVTFSLGLFKKIVIADYLSPVSIMLFDSAGQPTFCDSAFGILAYTLQLYFDFSGYSDMALGLGYIFGVNLPLNFNSPYQSLSIIDFWRRWHMTLSAFLKDYVYIPLGGNRGGLMMKYLNLMLTMLIGGLWHGAGWNYVLWGGLHGVYLVINHIYRRIVKDRFPLPRFCCWSLTFVSVSFAWIFFRSPSLTRAADIVAGFSKFRLNDIGLSIIALPGDELYKFSAVLLTALMLSVFAPNVHSLTRKLSADKYYMALFGGVCITISLWLMTYTEKVREFLYFQF